MDFGKLSGVFKAGGGGSDPVIKPSPAYGGNGGEEPPTPDDMHQSITHHLSSVVYNAKHAGAHNMETAKHSQMLLNLLKKVPGFAKHAKRV